MHWNCDLCFQRRSGQKEHKKPIDFKVFSSTITKEEEEEAETLIFSTTTNTTSQWENLPFELISDIFSRLPIKSLLRCRLVFKHWNLLTRTSQFIDLYNKARISYQPLTFAFPSFRYDKNGLNTLFLFQNDDETIRIPFEQKLQGPSYSVYASCNGFLLLMDRFCRNKTTPKLIIYNPITKEIIFDIPDMPKYACPQVCFGFNAKTHDYKLVLDHTYIITLGQTCWRKLSAPNDLVLETVGEPVFINGTFYSLHGNKDEILALDICTEKYRIIQGVNITKPLKDPDCRLLEYDNKLAYIVFDLESQKFHTWRLEDDQNNNWIHLSTKNISRLLRKHCCKRHWFKFEREVGNHSLLFSHHDADLYYKDRENYHLQGVWWYRTFIYTPKSGGHVISFTTNKSESQRDFRVFHFVPNLALLQNPDRSTEA